MTAAPIYPSLSTGANALTRPDEIIPSVIRHLVATPASISDLFEDRQLSNKASLRAVESQFGNDPKAFCVRMTDMLTAIINRYFPSRRFNVDIWYKLINDVTGDEEDPISGNENYHRYVCYIDIQEIVGQGVFSPVIVSEKVYIDKDTHEFYIDFESAKNISVK